MGDMAVNVDTIPPVEAPKKRKRSNAPVACHRCREQQLVCDGTKPMCERCISLGVACTGYFMKLQWDNGVASRGKMRNCILPFEGSAKIAKDYTTTSRSRRKTLSTSSVTPKIKVETGNEKGRPVPARSSTVANIHQPYGFIPNTQMTDTPSSERPVQWSSSAPVDSPLRIKMEDQTPTQELQQPTYPTTSMLNPLQTHNQMQPNYGYSQPSMTLSPQTMMPPSFPNYMQQNQQSESPLDPQSKYLSPNGQFPTYNDNVLSPSMNMAFSPNTQPGMNNYFPNHQDSMVDPQLLNSQPPSMPVENSFQNQPNYAQDSVQFTNPFLAYSQRFIPPETQMGLPTFSKVDVDSLETIHDDPEPGRELVASTNSVTDLGIYRKDSDRAQDLNYFMEYYTEVISPVIVAFDSQSNPYRKEILAIASDCPALRHAIAALSASNLRMRSQYKLSAMEDEPTDLSSSHELSVRRSFAAHKRLEPRDMPDPGHPSRPEVFHRMTAVGLLNEQLKNPLSNSAKEILATLLILCLYHICESGVAKFKTHFAGVKAVIASKKKQLKELEGIDWLVTMFKWFDAMTATVNDREGQFSDAKDRIEVLEDEETEWTLENLAGCDRKLFSIISRLGRLNMLSQQDGSSTQSEHVNFNESDPNSISFLGLPIPNLAQPISNITPNQTFFDGNGWTPLPGSSEFWHEWKETHEELSSWQFDHTTLPRPMRYNATEHFAQHGTYDNATVDLINISESFRHAALLYLERLIHPYHSSSAPNLQNLVQHALAYIRIVKSDVFLLWPLFIVGAECVTQADRQVIAERCYAIQKDSGFFNNIQCLDLLNKIWAKADVDENALRRSQSHSSSATGQTHSLLDFSDGYNGLDVPSLDMMFENNVKERFTWSQPMDRTSGGEYIII